MRIKEYDVLKGIGILLVVLGHTGISGLPYTFIYAFHMPLFFFVSGCFYKQRNFLMFLKKKANGLLLPYLFFVVCFFLMSLLLNSVQSNNLLTGIQTTLSTINPADEHCWILYRTIWFLLCLFEISVMYYIIDRFANSKIRKWGGVIMLSVIGFVLSRMYDYQCFFLDSACSCILYYALGHHFKNSRFEGWHPRLFYLILAGITLLTTVAVLRPDVALVRNRYPLYLPLIAVPLILVLFYAVKRSHSHIKRFSDCLSWLGDNSLAILGIHSVYYYLFDVFFADRLCGLQFATLKFVTTLPLIYISVILIKIIFPNMFGKYETKRI